MTSIFDPLHKHYAVHKEWIEGSFANPNDPPIVDGRLPDKNWFPLSEPDWVDYQEYRIKPRMITRTVSYPEPLKVLVLGQVFWTVYTYFDEPIEHAFLPFSWQEIFLKNGMCFATEADAWECHKALFGDVK